MLYYSVLYYIELITVIIDENITKPCYNYVITILNLVGGKCTFYYMDLIASYTSLVILFILLYHALHVMHSLLFDECTQLYQVEDDLKMKEFKLELYAKYRKQ